MQKIIGRLKLAWELTARAFQTYRERVELEEYMEERQRRLERQLNQLTGLTFRDREGR